MTPRHPDTDRLTLALIDCGGRLPEWKHWRERVSSKPSDPDDVRWDCSCGYSGNPDKVLSHIVLMVGLRLPAEPEARRDFGAIRALDVLEQFVRDADARYLDDEGDGYGGLPFIYRDELLNRIADLRAAALLEQA